MLTVLHEDNHVIAVVKPAGALVQGDASGERTLMDEVKDYLAHKYNKPGAVFLGLVHRLDRRVAGVIVFGRTSKGAARLSEQIRTRAVEKTYRAWVEGAMVGEQGELVCFMSADDGYVKAHDKPGPDRKEAKLGWHVLRREADRTLLEIDLHTGRKHQIRVQLARAGHAILGDDRYGAKLPWPKPAIALVSYRMSLKHPTLDAQLTFQLPEAFDISGK